MDLISYILSKKYADKLFAGGGAAKGKNCTIQSIEEIEGGNQITFQWTLDDGTVQTDTLDVMNGAPGEQGPKGDKGDQGETGPAGANGQDGRDGVDGQDGTPGVDGKDGKDGVNGQDGADGVGIVSIEKTQTVGLVDIYTITFTNGETSSFNVTNGADGASTAEDVEYDNSGTHLEATNVQDAISEIANGSSSKPNIKAIYEESPSTTAHSVNDYIYYDSHLYRVIAAIAIGDTLVVDTNIELASEIEEGTEVFIENLPGESSGGGGSSTDLPEGGTTGQVLTKNSDESGDASWQTPVTESKKIDFDLHLKPKKKFFDVQPNTWYCDTTHMLLIYGSDIWTDGENLYCSGDQYEQYVFDKNINKWVTKKWEGLLKWGDVPSANNIWTDGENIYFSRGNSDKHYILNKTTKRWEEKEWKVTDHNTGFLYGYGIWTDGENIYCSTNDTWLDWDDGVGTQMNYVLNKSTDTWVYKEWNGVTKFSGKSVWTDGENIYLDGGYILDKSTSTWVAKEWNGLSSFDGTRVWSDGENIYYSYYANQYVLDKNTDTWIVKKWEGLSDFDGVRIWKDGGNIYLNNEYMLDKNTSTWIPKNWSSLLPFEVYAHDIWTDGEEIYYSNNYVLDKNTNFWIDKEWYGLEEYTSDLGAGRLWTDGENIYFSDGRDNQYVLDKDTDTWIKKEWSGLAEDVYLEGEYVWTYNGMIYYSKGSEQYYYNKESGSWDIHSWGGEFQEFDGNHVWIDGTEVYYSNGDQQYKMNTSEWCWEVQEWTGLGEYDSLYANYIWTDGDNIYHSGGGYTRILSKGTNSWGIINIADGFSGEDIWTDGINLYNSSGSIQYILKENTKSIQYC